MNCWSSWKEQHRDKIKHVAGYEEAFVGAVLSQIPEISPDDVTPQFHFIDDRGGNRYIDFMIINKATGVYLPSPSHEEAYPYESSYVDYGDSGLESYAGGNTMTDANLCDYSAEMGNDGDDY
ncbi:hypothetical protein [Agarivorans sp. DSG3-1]|uniref:hypothetical protein n=1 Tax=Agarivorans sp. DSG3-1 TaxID=3342249 RepID=UPI00398E5FE3